MTFKDLAIVLLEKNVKVMAVEDFKYKFVLNGKIHGFYCFEHGNIIAPSIETQCAESGLIEYEPHDWKKAIMQ